MTLKIEKKFGCRGSQGLLKKGRRPFRSFSKVEEVKEPM